MSLHSPTTSGRKARRLALLAGAALVAVGAFLAVRHWRGDAGRGTSRPDDRALLQDRAVESGITFRMAFLPGEQGETFKINLYDHGCGVAVGDYDGDGYDDIYFLNQLGSNALYRNQGDGTFADVSKEAGVALGDRVCVGATFADYDNDGDPDLYVTSTRGGNVLFQNQGDGTFRDVTKQAGLTHVGHSQTAAFFDFDNDGWLDLLVTNTARWTTEDYDPSRRYYVGKGERGDLRSLINSPRESNVFYRNNGDGTFTDVTEKSGLKGRGWSGDVAVFDYNDDGRLDVLVTCMFGPAQLYRNNGDGTFTDVARQVLGPTSWGGIGAKVFASHNDGLLDLLIVDMHSDMWMGLDYDHSSWHEALTVAGKKFPSSFGPREMPMSEREWEDAMGCKRADVLFGNTFFKNLGKGQFVECSGGVNLETFWPWGIAAGDFDNDGHEDVFLTAGMGYPFYYWPNALMINNGNGTFTDRARAAGVEPPVAGEAFEEKVGGRPSVRSSRCAAVADFDGDGRLEIVTNNFNDRPYYFRNRFPKRNHIAFRLRGTTSNRDAVGAVVHLYAGRAVLTRQVSPAGGYLAQSSKTVHFGLGDRPKVDRVEITWPGGRRQTLTDPQLNTLHMVVEGED